MRELLAPAGDFKKLKTALHFGADAVYVGGNNYGLRASAGNFSDEELKAAVEYTHARSKKLYVTCNIVAHNEDFCGLKEYLSYLESIGVDAIIVSDPGILALARQTFSRTQIHLSTQANATNKYSCAFWAEHGVSRVVLARELSVEEISQIRDFLSPEVELECFVHGAMCISHSGRCLLSNYLTHRDGNRGACVQACRWEYNVSEVNRPQNPLIMSEDSRGTYIMNSKDLNMIEYLDRLIEAGVMSLKVEGRMKSQYYVGTVINAYRQVLDYYADNGKMPDNTDIYAELRKTAHRAYTTGFYFSDEDTINLESSQAVCDYDFCAEVLGYDENRKMMVVQQRNRFRCSDELELLSNNPDLLNKKIKLDEIYDENGSRIEDAKLVQQRLYIPCEYRVNELDMLRKKVR